MTQIFHPVTNTLSRVSILCSGLILVVVIWTLYRFYRSPYMTEAKVVRSQPVPFSHVHHVAGLGIDCRYCHTGVETSPFAGMPTTETCMNCHSQIWRDSPTLEPVRASFRSGQPIRWTRVHDLPNFVFFNHSIHVQKGIGCSSCHGPVDKMPLMWREHSLYMEWCIDCHRHPDEHVRPRDRVFDMSWHAPGDQKAIGEKLVEQYQIQGKKVVNLTDCSICHR